MDTTNPFRHAMVGEVLQSTLWQTSGPHSTPPGLGQLTRGGGGQGDGSKHSCLLHGVPRGQCVSCRNGSFMLHGNRWTGPHLYVNWERNLAPPQGSAICPHGHKCIHDHIHELWAVFSDYSSPYLPAAGRCQHRRVHLGYSVQKTNLENMLMACICVQSTNTGIFFKVGSFVSWNTHSECFIHLVRDG